MDFVERRRYVLDFTQAALGLVSSNMFAIGFETIDSKNFKAYFFIRARDSETDEDIQDILDDFEALQDMSIKITAEVVVDDLNVTVTGKNVILTYCAKNVTMERIV